MATFHHWLAVDPTGEETVTATSHRWLAVDPTGEETVTATSHHWLAVDPTGEETVSWPHFIIGLQWTQLVKTQCHGYISSLACSGPNW